MTDKQTLLDGAINANIEAYVKAVKDYEFFFKLGDTDIAEQYASYFNAIKYTLYRIFPSEEAYIADKLESALNS